MPIVSEDKASATGASPPNLIIIGCPATPTFHSSSAAPQAPPALPPRGDGPPAAPSSSAVLGSSARQPPGASDAAAPSPLAPAFTLAVPQQLSVPGLLNIASNASRPAGGVDATPSRSRTTAQQQHQPPSGPVLIEIPRNPVHPALYP
ncbi:hypothetical protein HK405_001000, partial [Cladochytrium tenue]